MTINKHIHNKHINKTTKQPASETYQVLQCMRTPYLGEQLLPVIGHLHVFLLTPYVKNKPQLLLRVWLGRNDQ